MALKIAELEAKKHNDLANKLRYLPEIQEYKKTILTNVYNKSNDQIQTYLMEQLMDLKIENNKIKKV